MTQNDKKFCLTQYLRNCTSYDCGFCYMCKMFKLEPFGIHRKLHNLLEDYLSNRFQRILLNAHESSWLPIKAGFPREFILGPLLFLIYINGLPDGPNSIAKLFVSDALLFGCHSSTIGIHHIHMYAFFYWCTHNFGHAYINMYAQFFQ